MTWVTRGATHTKPPPLLAQPTQPFDTFEARML